MNRVLVIGGGIGGLAAGVALRRHGFDAQVYEATPELRAVGAGITVPPNAMGVLDRLGLAEQVASSGIPLARMEIRDVDGDVLQVIEGDEVAAHHGFPLVGIRRSELQRILAGGLREGTLHLGKKLLRFEDAGAAVRAHFEDGSVEEGALLVGADGLRSTVRRQLRPDVGLRYSGQTCLRGLAPIRLPEEMHRTACEVWGGASRFGFLEVSDAHVYWFAPYDAPAGTHDTGPGLKDRLAERYRSFPGPVRDVIEATPADAIIQTDLYDLVPMRGWSVGRAVLLGDAAHATTPNLGQGGAQAIEDALSLALKLAAGGIDPAPLADYERVRAPRTHKIVGLSWRLGAVAHWKNPVLRRLRNVLLKATPQSVQQRQTDQLLTAVV